MNGCVIPGTSIAVDFWKTERLPNVRLFFLTHLHGDHVTGLTSSWSCPIYCSSLTAQLLEERYGLDHSVVHPLEDGQSHLIGCCRNDCFHRHNEKVISPLICERCQRKKGTCDSIQVTVIGANHCPGAVMFLFEGSFGKILHTGDFRYHHNMFEIGSILSKHIGFVDKLYLDNTYCDPTCVFPTREEALEEIIQIAKQHSDHDIVFGMRKLGKEDLLKSVALALGEWINVSPSIYSVASALGFPDVFKTGHPELRLRTAAFNHISTKYIRHLNTKKPTIVILPTAIFQGISGKPYANCPEIFIVPYSDHSSFPELVQFVSKLKPSCVIPIVNGKVRGPFGMDVSSRENMECFHPFLTLNEENQQVHHGTFPVPVSAKLDQPVDHTSLHPGEKQCTCRNAAGFECLFPDFQEAILKRKRSIKKRKRFVKKRQQKILYTKGVNYLSDNAQEGCSKDKSSQELLQKNRILSHSHDENIATKDSTNFNKGSLPGVIMLENSLDNSSDKLKSAREENCKKVETFGNTETVEDRLFSLITESERHQTPSFQHESHSFSDISKQHTTTQKCNSTEVTFPSFNDCFKEKISSHKHWSLNKSNLTKAKTVEKCENELANSFSPTHKETIIEKSGFVFKCCLCKTLSQCKSAKQEIIRSLEKAVSSIDRKGRTITSEHKYLTDRHHSLKALQNSKHSLGKLIHTYNTVFGPPTPK